MPWSSSARRPSAARVEEGRDRGLRIGARIRENLQRHGVAYLRVARFVDAHTEITHGGSHRRVTGDKILIATGSRARAARAGIDFTDPHIHDSDEILSIETLPASLTIPAAA